MPVLGVPFVSVRWFLYAVNKTCLLEKDKKQIMKLWMMVAKDSWQIQTEAMCGNVSYNVSSVVL